MTTHSTVLFLFLKVSIYYIYSFISPDIAGSSGWERLKIICDTLRQR